MRGSRNRTPRSLLGYAPKGDDLNRRPLREITDSEIATFESDGVVCLRQVLDWDWIERMRGAVDRIMASPSDRGTGQPAPRPNITSNPAMPSASAAMRAGVGRSPRNTIPWREEQCGRVGDA